MPAASSGRRGRRFAAPSIFLLRRMAAQKSTPTERGRGGGPTRSEAGPGVIELHPPPPPRGTPGLHRPPHVPGRAGGQVQRILVAQFSRGGCLFLGGGVSPLRSEKLRGRGSVLGRVLRCSGPLGNPRTSPRGGGSTRGRRRAILQFCRSKKKSKQEGFWGAQGVKKRLFFSDTFSKLRSPAVSGDPEIVRCFLCGEPVFHRCGNGVD